MISPAIPHGKDSFGTILESEVESAGASLAESAAKLTLELSASRLANASSFT